MDIIRSAYNFAPVESGDEMFSPDGWKDIVQMDIPFQDACSGYITYKLKAETPVFICGSDGNFPKAGGRYFIPATTVKGCFRNILEIISYGYLGKGRVQNKSFPYRNLQDFRGYMNKMKSVYCGWLGKDVNGKRVIRNYARPHHISYTELERYLKQNHSCPNYKKLSVYEKYQKFGYIYEDFTDPHQKKSSNSGRPDYRKFCEFGGGNKGYVVFSGSITKKSSDFVLLERDMNKNEILPVGDKVWESFNECYLKPKDKENTNIPTYKYKGFDGLLVFFTKDGDGHVTSIGLNYLHKYVAESSVYDAIPGNLFVEKQMNDSKKNASEKNPRDLADVMFGSEKDGLRGRIQFGHAFAQKAELLFKNGDSILTILDSPKASFYPTYLQNGKTWDDKGACISGYKRYPIKPRFDIRDLDLKESFERGNYDKIYPNEKEKLHSFKDCLGNRYIPKAEDRNQEAKYDTTSKLRPLKDGATFEGRIMFFNLRKEELGALISAMTFHGHDSECKHSVGAAKAMGFGAMSISNIHVTRKHTASGADETVEYKDSFAGESVKAFEDMMEKHVSGWKRSPRISELIEMAKGFKEEDCVEFLTPLQLKALLSPNDKGIRKEGSEFSYYKLQQHKGNASFVRFSEIKMAVRKSGTQQQVKPAPKTNNVSDKNSITRQEQEKGWFIREGWTYNGIVTNGGKLCINRPVKSGEYFDPKFSIYCNYVKDGAMTTQIIPNRKFYFQIVAVDKVGNKVKITDSKNR